MGLLKPLIFPAVETYPPRALKKENADLHAPWFKALGVQGPGSYPVAHCTLGGGTADASRSSREKRRSKRFAERRAGKATTGQFPELPAEQTHGYRQQDGDGELAQRQVEAHKHGNAERVWGKICSLETN